MHRRAEEGYQFLQAGHLENAESIWLAALLLEHNVLILLFTNDFRREECTLGSLERPGGLGKDLEGSVPPETEERATRNHI